MLKYKIPQIVTLTLLNPPGLSGEPSVTNKNINRVIKDQRKNLRDFHFMHII